MTYGVKRIKEKELVDMADYTHILNVQETRIFFDTLRDIYRLYLDYSSPPGYDTRRRGGRTARKRTTQDLQRATSTQISPQKTEGDLGLEESRDIAEDTLGRSFGSIELESFRSFDESRTTHPEIAKDVINSIEEEEEAAEEETEA